MSASLASSASRAATEPLLIRSRIVGLLFALSAMSYFDRTVISIAGPGIMRDFGISETQMGSIYSSFLLSYTILMVPSGWLADRFGGRRVLTVSGLGAALSTGLTSICGPGGLGAWLGVVPAFILVRLAFGACTAPLYPATARITAAWVPPHQRARTQAVIISAAAVGSAVSPILFSRLITAYGWRASFWAAAVATAVVILTCHTWVHDRQPGDVEQASSVELKAKTAWRVLLADRNLQLLTGSYFTLSYFEYIFYYWIFYYFGQVRHMAARETAWATTAIFISMAVMTPLGGWASDRMAERFGPAAGRRIVPIAAMASSAGLLYVGASGLGDFATVVVLSLAVGLSMAPEGTFWSTAMHIGGKQIGAACGIMNCGGNVGGVLAPVLTPVIASRFGWSGGLYFASVMVMLGMLAWFLIKPTYQVGGGSEVG